MARTIAGRREKKSANSAWSAHLTVALVATILRFGGICRGNCCCDGWPRLPLPDQAGVRLAKIRHRVIMAGSANPYTDLPPQAYWRTGVAEPGLFGLKDLWASPWELPSDARFSTYGSCFAQHISRALVAIPKETSTGLSARKAPARPPPCASKPAGEGRYRDLRCQP